MAPVRVASYYALSLCACMLSSSLHWEGLAQHEANVVASYICMCTVIPCVEWYTSWL